MRAPNEVAADIKKVWAAIKRKKGHSAAELVAATGLTRSVVNHALLALRADAQVGIIGDRRLARYVRNQ